MNWFISSVCAQMTTWGNLYGQTDFDTGLFCQPSQAECCEGTWSMDEEDWPTIRSKQTEMLEMFLVEMQMLQPGGTELFFALYPTFLSIIELCIFFFCQLFSLRSSSSFVFMMYLLAQRNPFFFLVIVCSWATQRLKWALFNIISAVHCFKLQRSILCCL